LLSDLVRVWVLISLDSLTLTTSKPELLPNPETQKAVAITSSSPGFNLQSDPDVQVPPHSVEELEEVVSTLGTVEEVLKYLDPDRWQADMEELNRPSWHGLGKSFLHNKKTRGRG